MHWQHEQLVGASRLDNSLTSSVDIAPQAAGNAQNLRRLSSVSKGCYATRHADEHLELPVTQHGDTLTVRGTRIVDRNSGTIQ